MKSKALAGLLTVLSAFIMSPALAQTTGTEVSADKGKPHPIEEFPGGITAREMPNIPVEEWLTRKQGGGARNRLEEAAIEVAEAPADTAGSKVHSDQDAGPTTETTSSETTTSLSLAAPSTQNSPTAIAEMARALKHDPDLIYEFVRDNIETYPIFGIHKGARGALLDGQGTNFDQTDLLVQLVRASGYSASYAIGVIDLTPAQISDYYGMPTENGCRVQRFFDNGQIPVTVFVGSAPTCDAPVTAVRLVHSWARVTLPEGTFVFDPSLKSHRTVAGINVTTASGYSRAQLLSSGLTGATITPDSIQNLDREALRAQLDQYALQLAESIRQNAPSAGIAGVLGGREIVPAEACFPGFDYQCQANTGLRRTQLPYQNTSYSTTIYSGSLPTNYKVLLRLTFAGIAPVIVADSAYGRRLTISPNANLQPELRADGILLATGAAIPAGTDTDLTVEIFHQAYASTFANEGMTRKLKSGETQNVVLGLGLVSPRLNEIFLDQAQEAAEQQLDPSSEPSLGPSLATLGADWMAQFSQTVDLIAKVSNSTIHKHHIAGLVGQSGAPVFDVLSRVTYVQHDGDVDRERGQFLTLGMAGSAFESGVIEQVLNKPGLSTVSVLDQAVLAGQQIYKATGTNYATAVEPNLVNCDAQKPAFASNTASGLLIVTPRNCVLAQDQWSGAAYLAAYADNNQAVLSAIIGGGHLGGYSSFPLGYDDWGVPYYRRDRHRPTRQQKRRGDPVQMPTGAFDYSHDDISVGTGSFPYELTFRKTYNSELRSSDGPLGRGWSHNFDMRASAATLAMQGLGQDSPIDAATTIVHILAGVDLLSDANLPLANLLTHAVSANWFTDMLQDNAVIVTADGPAEIFVRLPDGSFNAPPSSSAKLTANVDGTLLLSSAHKEQVSFNADGLATAWTSPNGLALQFGYSNGLLTNVANSLGRSLTFAYTNDRITLVSDGNGRSVAYGYDSAGNLTAYTDSLTQTTSFEYDLPGRMTRFFLPANPTVAQVDNTYDNLGRIMQQVDADGELWTYYIGGTRSELVTPAGRRLIDYFGRSGETLATYENTEFSPINARTWLKRQFFEYDGRGRLIRNESNFEPTLELVYDDATCSGSEKRCTHNIMQRIRKATRRGSASTELPPQTVSFTYEPLFNRIATETSPSGGVTDYAYNSATGNLASATLPAPTTGTTRPQTQYTYGTFAGAAGFGTFTLPTQVTEKINASTLTSTAYTYDSANKYVRASVTADSGGIAATTTYTHDGVGNQLTADLPRTDVSDIVTYAYDAERRLLSTQDPTGKLTKLGRNIEGELVRVSTQEGSQWLATCRTLAPSGKLLSDIGPARVADELSCPTDTGITTFTDFDYDGEGNLALHTVNRTAGQGGDRITGYSYGASGELTRIEGGIGTPLQQYTMGTSVSYASFGGPNPPAPYNHHNYLMPLDHYSNPSRRLTINGHGLLTDFYIPSGGGVGYTYDISDNITQINRGGQIVQFSRDALGRAVNYTPPESSARAVFSYDTLGRVTAANAAASGGISVTMTYDALDRLTSETTPLGTVSYQYDKIGNRTRITWPGGFYVTYSYDALGRMTEIRENGTVLLASYGYDDLSRRTTLTYGNGTTTTYGYDDQSRLASLGINLAGTTADVTWTYGYDQSGALITQTSSNGSYDWNGHYNVNRTYQSSTDFYTSSGSNTLTYDSRKNLTGDGTWTFTYDSQNRMTKAVVGQIQANYTYDLLGRLYSRYPKSTKETVRYLHAGQQLIAEYNNSGVLVRRYVPGSRLDEVVVVYEGTGGSTKSWLYADRLGSTVAVANASGTLTGAYSYGPFGEPNTSTGVPLRYTGRTLDPATGLYFYRARWYSPYLGRFLSRDPDGIADGLQTYTYVANDPINHVDPTGRFKQWASDALDFGWEAVDFVPIAGELKAAYEFDQNPSWENAGWLVAGLSPYGDMAKLGRKAARSEAADGLVYRRTDTTGRLAPYYGQTTEANELARQAAHNRAHPNSRFEFETVESGIPRGVQLDIAEHNAIQAHTGGVAARNSSAVSNQRDPVGPRRRPALGLPEPK